MLGTAPIPPAWSEMLTYERLCLPVTNGPHWYLLSLRRGKKNNTLKVRIRNSMNYPIPTPGSESSVFL
jgi:hypothetical protein